MTYFAWIADFLRDASQIYRRHGLASGDRIDDYLQEVAGLFPQNSLRARRALKEIENHLRERADQLQCQGIDAETAATTAVERFGKAIDVFHQFEVQAPFESEVDTMIRNVLTGITGLTTAFAALFFVFSFYDDAAVLTTIAKLLLSTAILGFNLVSLYWLWRQRGERPWLRWAVFAGALFLVILGSAGFAWTAHLGLLTGDWESYGFLMSALLVFQGCFTVTTNKLNDCAAPKVTA
jgi:hypothetical protein